jgi:hypothetical protein
MIDSLSKAARHGMLIRAECECGNRQFFRASDLAMIVRGDPDYRAVRFQCTRCRPKITVEAIAVDRDRLPRIMVNEPVWGENFKVMGWTTTRLK